jgi:hypothetical protein
LYRCTMVPADVRLAAQAVRDTALRLVKRSQQLVDGEGFVIREAETALFASQKALRAAMTRRTAS